jgi:hypothetical protein
VKQREKILAIGVGVCVLVVGLRAAYLYYDETYTQRQNHLDTLEKKIRDQDVVLKQGANASKSFSKWQARALPPDRSAAKSLYQKWLLEVTKRAGLKDPKITAATQIAPLALPRNALRRQATPGVANTPKVYERFGYTLAADVSLTEIVRLLYEFYSANHLHRITKLEVALPKAGSNLSLTMTVDGLMLPGATNTDKLSTAKSDRLEFADLAAYEKSIVGRNLFAEYKPPPPPPQPRVEVRRDPPPPPPPAFDKAKHATVTGIVEQNDEPQLWVRVKTTGELLKLSEGEEFTIGDMKCTVVRINTRDAELATGDKRFVVKLQDNLRDASTGKSSDL